MSFATELRRAVDTGKVIFGSKRTQKLLLNGQGKILVLSKNIPMQKKERLIHLASLHNIKYIEADANSKEIGEICGKPFNVLALLILDLGRSKLLQEKKTTKKTKRKTKKTKK